MTNFGLLYCASISKESRKTNLCSAFLNNLSNLILKLVKSEGESIKEQFLIFKAFHPAFFVMQSIKKVY